MSRPPHRKKRPNRSFPGIPALLLALVLALTPPLLSHLGIDLSLWDRSSGYSYTLEDLPAYSGEPYVVLNDNIPNFPDTDRTTVAFERYSPLDELGRCGVAYANIGTELMPTEERGEIGMIKPTGWQTVRYDCVEGSYLYNRCHLIAYMLTGENANEKNLITGTRYLNTTGMLPFERQVHNYIEETGHHVLYRATPIFEGDDLLARGVELEAYSVEDAGEGVQFHVFLYNVQPGVELDYSTGENRLSETAE